ncbi:MAG: hypothetical protein WCT18_03890 [Patescibacteria group bacterium]
MVRDNELVRQIYRNLQKKVFGDNLLADSFHWGRKMKKFLFLCSFVLLFSTNVNFALADGGGSEVMAGIYDSQEGDAEDTAEVEKVIVEQDSFVRRFPEFDEFGNEFYYSADGKKEVFYIYVEDNACTSMATLAIYLQYEQNFPCIDLHEMLTQNSDILSDAQWANPWECLFSGMVIFYERPV